MPSRNRAADERGDYHTPNTQTPRDTHVGLKLLKVRLLLRLVLLDLLRGLGTGVLELLHTVCGLLAESSGLTPEA